MKRWLPLLAVTAFLRVYSPDSNWQASPTSGRRVPMKHEVSSSFGANYVGAGRLAWLAGMEVRMRDGRMLDGALFDIGARWQALPRILFELKHGSWHNVDSPGSVEHFNYLGLEVRL